MSLKLSRQSDLTVLGAGSWGTALTLYFSKRLDSVNLWSPFQEEVDRINTDGENRQFLPGVSFPNNIKCHSDLNQLIVKDCTVVMAVPSHVFLNTIDLLLPLENRISNVVIATKGITEQGEFLHSLTQDKFSTTIPISILAGPSFAKEVAQGLPSSLALASQDKEVRQQLASLLHSPIFRIVPCDDLMGVALGGVVKNVIAIAVGLSDGLGFGANARAALITRGLEELYSLGKEIGAKLETVTGLAGLGDMVLTTTDDQSRNRRFGLALGQGQTVELAEKNIGQVVEGKYNVESLLSLAEKLNVPLPICHQVYLVINGQVSAKKAMDNILA